MARLIWGWCLAAAVVTGCASAPARRELSSPAGLPGQLVRRVVHLASGALACPISPHLAYTAGHAFDPGMGADLAWRRGPNEGGTVRLVARLDHDLAIVQSEVPFPEFSAVATAAPEIGNELVVATMTDFPLHRPGISLYWGRAFGVDAEGDLLLDAMAAPGMSGGCVWNSRGEVVAIATSITAWRSQPWVRSMSASAPVWRRGS